MANRRFMRGSAAFKCRTCGRTTRDTNNGNGALRLCPDCEEGHALQNMADNLPDGDPRKAQARRDAYACFERSINKGGIVAGVLLQPDSP